MDGTPDRITEVLARAWIVCDPNRGGEPDAIETGAGMSPPSTSTLIGQPGFAQEPPSSSHFLGKHDFCPKTGGLILPRISQRPRTCTQMELARGTIPRVLGPLRLAVGVDDRLCAAIITCCAKGMDGFAACFAFLKHAGERPIPPFLQFIALLLSVPCFKASHLCFKATYVLNQRRLRRVCGEDFFLKFYTIADLKRYKSELPHCTPERKRAIRHEAITVQHLMWGSSYSLWEKPHFKTMDALVGEILAATSMVSR